VAYQGQTGKEGEGFVKSNLQFLFLSHGIFSIKKRKKEKKQKPGIFKSLWLSGTAEGRQALPTLVVGVSPKS